MLQFWNSKFKFQKITIIESKYISFLSYLSLHNIFIYISVPLWKSGHQKMLSRSFYPKNALSILLPKTRDAPPWTLRIYSVNHSLINKELELSTIWRIIHISDMFIFLLFMWCFIFYHHLMYFLFMIRDFPFSKACRNKTILM